MGKRGVHPPRLWKEKREYQQNEKDGEFQVLLFSFAEFRDLDS